MLGRALRRPLVHAVAKADRGVEGKQEAKVRGAPAGQARGSHALAGTRNLALWRGLNATTPRETRRNESSFSYEGPIRRKPGFEAERDAAKKAEAWAQKKPMGSPGGPGGAMPGGFDAPPDGTFFGKPGSKPTLMPDKAPPRQMSGAPVAGKAVGSARGAIPVGSAGSSGVAMPASGIPEEVPVPELSAADAQLREQLLQRATLVETAKGREGLEREAGAKFERPGRAESGDGGVAAAAAAASAAALEGKSKVTPLLEEMLTRVRMSPIPMSEYMSQALAHPKHGYYMSRDVFGEKGDFVTAPEISQMFGELVGIWVVWMWQALGQPEKVQLVELGPGRGTMMDDMLRSISKFKPLVNALTVELVETSPALRDAQRKKLSQGWKEDSREARHAGTGILIRWRDSLEEVPIKKDVPSIMIAQEFLDCMPVKQFQYTELGWCERMIAEDPTPEGPHHLRYMLSKGPTPSAKMLLNKSIVPKLPDKPGINEGIEVSPDALWVAQEIGRRVSLTKGAALIIDYGNDGPAVDSVQAMKEHKFVDVLSEPGECDVTAHVDFSAVKKAALDGSTQDAQEAAKAAAIAMAASAEKTSIGGKKSPYHAAVHSAKDGRQGMAPLVVHGPATQSVFLHGMGIRERAQGLLQKATAAQAEKLQQEYTRLCSPDEMGTLFKVLAITPDSIPEGQAAGFPPPEPEPEQAEPKPEQDSQEGSGTAAAQQDNTAPPASSGPA